MPFTIDQTFQVRAPADRVWNYLIDPRQVVECLPGAELVAAVDDRTYDGKVTIRVGPVKVSYEGRVTMEEVNPTARTVRVRGEGNESAGSGAARMTMTSSLKDLGGGLTEVTVHADVDVAGKVVQFGRGMVDAVNKQLFAQFVTCVQGKLESAAPASGAAAPATGGAPAGNQKPDDSWVSTDAPIGDRESQHAGAAKPGSAPDKSLSIIPVLWRALRDMFAGWFGRGKAR
jgi:carbon monoxide dehydrogenase subunit G